MDHPNMAQFCGPVKTVVPLEYDIYPVGMPSVDYPDALEAANAQIHVSRTPLFTVVPHVESCLGDAAAH